MPRYTEIQQATGLILIILKEGNLSAAQHSFHEVWGKKPSRKSLRRWRERERLPRGEKSPRERAVSEKANGLRHMLLAQLEEQNMTLLRMAEEKKPAGTTLREALEEVGVADKVEQFISGPPATDRAQSVPLTQLLW